MRHCTGSVREQFSLDVLPSGHLAAVCLVARPCGGALFFGRDGLVLPEAGVAVGETGVVCTLKEDGRRVERLFGKGVHEAVEISAGHILTVPPARGGERQQIPTKFRVGERDGH